MSPLCVHAASLVPSEDDVTEYQYPEPTAWSVQLAPLFVEVQMSPLYAHAASFVPSDEDVTETHCLVPAAI